MTLIFNEKSIKNNIEVDKKLIPIIEKAFVDLSIGKIIMPPILRLDIKEFLGEVDVKTAYVKGLDSFAIKISPGFFNNPSLGLPSTNGLMILFDSKTGTIKSILIDKGYLTDLRTAIAGAIAAKYLSNHNIDNLGIIGAGMQAKMQIFALMLVRKPSKIRIWSRNINKVTNLINQLQDKSNITYINESSPKEVVTNSDLVITTTPSAVPIIKSEWIHKGLHITAMGSDAEHKNELDSKIIKNCDLYVPDNQSQTSRLGELHHAIKNNIVSPKQKFNDLGNIIKNKDLGRSSKDQITVCDLTGTGAQDTFIARYAFKILNKKNLGKKIN